MPTTLRRALSAIPKGLLNPLLREYEAALEAVRGRKWETVGLKAGKLSEIIYTIVKGHIDGSFPSRPAKPANMVSACTALESADSTKFKRSLRIQIPRVLIAVYELRNNRDIGHVGGDVDPNEMDGEYFDRAIKWLIAELVRVFHNVSTAEARQIVETVSERSIPQIWEGDGKIRVLLPSLPMKDKVLLVLYHAVTAMDVKRLQEAVEYSNASVFAKSVLKKLHKEKLIEFDRDLGTVILLPPGVQHVEANLLADS
jgi:hypothetical protein